MNLVNVLILSLFLGHSVQEEPPAPKKEVLRLAVDVASKISQESLAENGLPVTLKLVNQSKDDIRVTPWIAIEVFDENEEPTKTSRKSGRWGRSRGCRLEALKIDTVKAGETLTRSADVARYTIDPESILEWKLKPGSYRLVFSYAADPSELRKRCSCKDVDHEDAEKAWNKVTKLEASVEVKVVIE